MLRAIIRYYTVFNGINKKFIRGPAIEPLLLFLACTYDNMVQAVGHLLKRMQSQRQSHFPLVPNYIFPALYPLRPA